MLEGHCQFSGGSTPYLPFLDALRRELHLEDLEAPDVLRDKVLRYVPAVDAGLARYLPHYLHLLSIPAPEHRLPEGIEGERLRQHLLRLEAEIRALVFRGTTGTLRKLWGRALKTLSAGVKRTEAKALKESAAKAFRALPAEGELIGCNAGTPGRLITHAWAVVEARKARALKERIDGLALKLSNILQADYMNSDDARSAAHLKESIGPSYHAAFDFGAVAR